MPTDDPLDAFRLALSYQEKVAGDLDNWENISESQKLDATRYDQVKSTYVVHLKKITRIVDRLRGYARAELEPLEKSLKKELRSQRKLGDRVAKGDLKPKKANEANRVLAERIADLEGRLEVVRPIALAETTEELGGFIDCPLEEYERRIALQYPEEVAAADERTGFNWNVVGFALIAVSIFWMVYYSYMSSGGGITPPSVKFSAEMHEEDPGLIRVVCTNVGAREINLYVPWPEGLASAPAAEAFPRFTFGIQLYAVEQGSDSARLVPSSEGSWKYRGSYLSDSRPITVPPGLSANLLLDTRILREQGVDATSVQIVLSRHGAAEVGRFDTVVESAGTLLTE